MLQCFLKSWGSEYFFVGPFLILLDEFLSFGFAGVDVWAADEWAGDLGEACFAEDFGRFGAGVNAFGLDEYAAGVVFVGWISELRYHFFVRSR